MWEGGRELGKYNKHFITSQAFKYKGKGQILDDERIQGLGNITPKCFWERILLVDKCQSKE